MTESKQWLCWALYTMNGHLTVTTASKEGGAEV